VVFFFAQCFQWLARVAQGVSWLNCRLSAFPFGLLESLQNAMLLLTLAFHNGNFVKIFWKNCQSKSFNPNQPIQKILGMSFSPAIPKGKPFFVNKS